MPTNAAFIEIEELNAIALAQEADRLEEADESRILPQRKSDEYGSISPSRAGGAEQSSTPASAEVTKKASPLYLIGLMLLLIVVGTTLTIVTKLQTIPMHNYSAALNIESVIVVSCNYIYMYDILHYVVSIIVWSDAPSLCPSFLIPFSTQSIYQLGLAMLCSYPAEGSYGHMI